MARPSFPRPSNPVLRSGSSDSSVEDLEINKPSEAPTASPIVTGVPSSRIPKLTRKKGDCPSGSGHWTHSHRQAVLVPIPHSNQVCQGATTSNRYITPLSPRCRPPSEILGNSVSLHPRRPGACRKKAAPIRAEHIVGPVLRDPHDESTIQKHQRAHRDDEDVGRTPTTLPRWVP